MSQGENADQPENQKLGLNFLFNNLTSTISVEQYHGDQYLLF